MASENTLLKHFGDILYSFIIKGTIDAPPVSPNVNDQYIIKDPKPDTIFKNAHNGCIAIYNGNDWIISLPKNGDLLYDESNNSIMYYAYVDGAYKWNESTKFAKNYGTNLIAKFAHLDRNAPIGNKYAQHHCHFITMKDYDNDTIPAEIRHLIKVNPNNLDEYKFFNMQWDVYSIGQIKSLADTVNRFLCIDDGVMYKFDEINKQLVSCGKAAPNVLYYCYNCGMVTYDAKTDKVYVICINPHNTIFAGAPKTTRLDNNPLPNAKMGGLVKYDVNQTALNTPRVNPTNLEHVMRNWLFFKYNIANYTIMLTSLMATNKKVILPIPIAVGKSGLKSMRLCVNGITQVEGIDYTITNDQGASIISWDGLGMDQLRLLELINTNKKVAITVMYMIERKIKRD